MNNYKQIGSLMAVIFCLMFGALLIASCSDDGPTTPETSNLLTGTVIDPQGNPVEGAGILVNYTLPIVMRPTTQIQFEIPEPTHAKAWVMSDCQTDTIKILLDESLTAGVFQVPWDATNIQGLGMPSGLYEFHLQCGAKHFTQSILLMRDDFHPEEAPTAFQFQATTNVDGEFSLEQNCLPFGFSSYSFNAMGDTISTWSVPREVKFFAMHQNYNGASSDWIIADEENGSDVTIQFSINSTLTNGEKCLNELFTLPNAPQEFSIQ